MNPQVWWLTARATGIVAWALLSLSVVLGAALSTRALGRRPAPSWLQAVHRASGGLAITFTAVHLVALVADTWAHFDLADLLVPLVAEWNPLPVAAGVVAFWLLLAVEGTSLARRRIGVTWWRRIHATSFVLWVLATAHLLTAGSDADDPWLAGAVLATTVIVATLVLTRVLLPRRGSRQTRARVMRTGGRDPRRGLAQDASGSTPWPIGPGLTATSQRKPSGSAK